MEFRLIPTRAYRSARDALRSDARVALNHVEDAIREDPHHRVRRYQRPDGVTIDYSAQGLFVAYRLIGPALVELVEVIDLKDAPGWP